MNIYFYICVCVCVCRLFHFLFFQFKLLLKPPACRRHERFRRSLKKKKNIYIKFIAHFLVSLSVTRSSWLKTTGGDDGTIKSNGKGKRETLNK